MVDLSRKPATADNPGEVEIATQAEVDAGTAQDKIITPETLERSEAVRRNKRNLLINGNMDFWQRGTSGATTSSGRYLADRWHDFENASAFDGTVSRQQEDIFGNGNTTEYVLQVERTNGNTNENGHFLQQALETVNTIPLQGKKVTLSFYARKGTGYTPAGDVLVARIIGGTGIDETPINFTGQITLEEENAVLTSSWQRFSLTATVPTNITQIMVRFIANHIGTAGVNDIYRIGKIMLNEGDTAAPFARAGNNIQEELAMAQRYYEKTYPVDVAPGSSGQDGVQINYGGGPGNDQVRGFAEFKVTKRAVPTGRYFDGAGNENRITAGSTNNITISSGTTPVSVPTERGHRIDFNVSTGDVKILWHWTADAEL